MAGLVVHRGLNEGDFIAVGILRTIHAFLPHLLGQLVLGRLDIVAFGKEAGLVGQGKEHGHTTLDAFLFQMLHQLATDAGAFMLGTHRQTTDFRQSVPHEVQRAAAQKMVALHGDDIIPQVFVDGVAGTGQHEPLLGIIIQQLVNIFHVAEFGRTKSNHNQDSLIAK